MSTDNLKILGELEIPGFPNYLHPYDEEHIIGISLLCFYLGESRVQQLGIKIALFNVKDVNNPKVTDEIIIGDRSTQSEVLYNHKAFFFDKTREIISIPISGDIERLNETPSKRIAPEYNRWNGFYVLDLNNSEGFSIKGTVTHSNDNSHYYGINNARALYIDDVIYTASDEYLKMNFSNNLEKINSIKLENTGKFINYFEEEILR